MHSTKPKLLILGAMAALSCGSTVSAETANRLGDDVIVAIYVQVNSFDIETALLAQAKDCDPDVTALATHLATDHLAVRKGILALAEDHSLGYALPASRAADQAAHDAIMAQLSDLDCAQFGPAFLEHDVAFHEAAIGAVRDVLLPQSASPALKEHFESVLPAFEKHLSMAVTVRDGGSISDHDTSH